jgi:ribosomal protein L6P/L9E
MVGDEIIVEGFDVEKDKLEAANCRHLGLPEPVTQKKGFIVQLFKR